MNFPKNRQTKGDFTCVVEDFIVFSQFIQQTHFIKIKKSDCTCVRITDHFCPSELESFH